jgi:fructose/tagatose bisphosphate aldolase
LAVYADAARQGWVIPTFCSENLTTTEAVLTAALEHGERIGRSDVPVTLAVTNLYPHRRQTTNYTATGRWDVGLRLFLADIEALTAPGSPFAALRVMTHLDHIQPDEDAELLKGDLSAFSSIMFDASAGPMERNVELTAEFVRKRGSEIVVEGACDEIVDATGAERSDLTTPERAEDYLSRAGVDFIVANLGTEHRASAANLCYHGDLARQISARVGPRIVLHGCSSVPVDQVANLFADGVAKVNIWTALERDSSPALFEAMVKHASKVAGPDVTRRLAAEGLLGPEADCASPAGLDWYTTVSRQTIVFQQMKRIAGKFFETWYTTSGRSTSSGDAQ